MGSVCGTPNGEKDGNPAVVNVEARQPGSETTPTVTHVAGMPEMSLEEEERRLQDLIQHYEREERRREAERAHPARTAHAAITGTAFQGLG